MTAEQNLTPLTKKEQRDLQLLVRFTAVYCQYHHDGPKSGVEAGSEPSALLPAGPQMVCNACREFLAYAVARRMRCPLDPKPVCKHCPVHCYRPDYRQQVRQVMRFSGKHLLLRGRLDLLWHYFF